MSESYNGEYRTMDLALASALEAIGIYALRIEDEDERRKAFVFADTGVLREQTMKFRKEEMLIEPRRYFTALRSLKARIHDANP